MDAPYSRRALLAAGVAAGASATAGCIGEIVPGDDSPNERTVAGIGIGNRQDRDIEVSLLLRVKGELEFWERYELTTSEAGRDHLVDGPWYAAPGDLQVWARYRPVDETAEIRGAQVYEYTLEGDHSGCITLSTLITDQYGIEVFAQQQPADGSTECPPLGER